MPTFYRISATYLFQIGVRTIVNLVLFYYIFLYIPFETSFAQANDENFSDRGLLQGAMTLIFVLVLFFALAYLYGAFYQINGIVRNNNPQDQVDEEFNTLVSYSNFSPQSSFVFDGGCFYFILLCFINPELSVAQNCVDFALGFVLTWSLYKIWKKQTLSLYQKIFAVLVDKRETR